MKENLPKMFPILLIGILLGYILSQTSGLSVANLRTPSNTYMGEDKDIIFANSLGLASFYGSWLHVSGEEIINNVNSVSVDCWLEKKICNIAQSNILPDGLFINDISYFEITEWSPLGQITAISGSICEDQVLKADIKTKVVTLTEARKDNADKTTCVESTEPVVLKLDRKGY